MNQSANLKFKRALIAAAVLLLFIPGCNSQNPATTTPTGTTTQPPSQVTFGQLASAGQAVYASRCASCHGNAGQGAGAPPLWGANSHLSDLGNAQLLLSFTSGSMPPGAAGTISRQNHIEIAAYLLLQNGWVTQTEIFNESQLSSIILR